MHAGGLGQLGFPLPSAPTRRRLSFFVGRACVTAACSMWSSRWAKARSCFCNATRTPSPFSMACPARVMVDNCKTAVLSHPLGQPAQLNPRYLDFANHYGFKIRACGVRKGNEKGRVENGVKYIKENFLRGPGTAALARAQPGRPPLAGDHRQRPHSRPDPPNTLGVVRAGKAQAQTRLGLALRCGHRAFPARQQPLPRAPGNQSLLGARASGRRHAGRQDLPGAAGALSPRPMRGRAWAQLRTPP